MSNGDLVTYSMYGSCHVWDFSTNCKLFVERVHNIAILFCIGLKKLNVLVTCDHDCMKIGKVRGGSNGRRRRRNPNNKNEIQKSVEKKHKEGDDDDNHNNYQLIVNRSVGHHRYGWSPACAVALPANALSHRHHCSSSSLSSSSSSSSSSSLLYEDAVDDEDDEDDYFATISEIEILRIWNHRGNTHTRAPTHTHTHTHTHSHPYSTYITKKGICLFSSEPLPSPDVDILYVSALVCLHSSNNYDYLPSSSSDYLKCILSVKFIDSSRTLLHSDNGNNENKPRNIMHC